MDFLEEVAGDEERPRGGKGRSTDWEAQETVCGGPGGRGAGVIRTGRLEENMQRGDASDCVRGRREPWGQRCRLGPVDAS